MPNGKYDMFKSGTRELTDLMVHVWYVTNGTLKEAKDGIQYDNFTNILETETFISDLKYSDIDVQMQTTERLEFKP